MSSPFSIPLPWYSQQPPQRYDPPYPDSIVRPLFLSAAQVARCNDQVALFSARQAFHQPPTAAVATRHPLDTGGSPVTVPLNSASLATSEQAQAIASRFSALFGLQGEFTDATPNGPAPIEWNGETRRVWAINYTLPDGSPFALDVASAVRKYLQASEAGDAYYEGALRQMGLIR